MSEQKNVTSATEDEEDPVAKAIQKTGCLDIHHALQECMAEKQDWRKCQDLVQQFKECMNNRNPQNLIHR
ncbi:hypothetical protein RvY_05712 [Ramazzottius varieornatus]|uniref:CHCH domain-containing protein n=1 Tax=Ramazzottius varieornatus TaxID=947166 RepID=A0A1D1V5R3_RAMVA|nr:hypothetical protein RvY_05712 [Ramazzottius varieornatus]